MIDPTETKQIIFTSSADSSGSALDEIKAIDPGMRVQKWLGSGVGLVQLEVGWELLAKGFQKRPPIFLRHICPVQLVTKFSQRLADIERLAALSSQFIPIMKMDEPFSVQKRLLGNEWPYKRYDVNTRLADKLRAFQLDVRSPKQVLSVVLTPDRGYLGLSKALENLSDWAGGERRFKREEDQISRAEFKFLEAIECFDLVFPNGGLALDLGASPGGWTRILGNNGMAVVAVDPAVPDHRLQLDASIEYVPATAQRYLSNTDRQFDVIVNDMRMDARDSAKLMVKAGRRLTRQGWALMTLKLPKKGEVKIIKSALKILRRKFQVIGIRQLFHNRNEVTVALQPLSPIQGNKFDGLSQS
jgi:23S rRNA (cytidine2498-2'-O)-methyltransferase